jgi:Trk K+ transport system NAD-binding subunit
LRAENRRHFERTNADELVVSAEMTGSLLAASAVTHGLSRVVADLITHPVGNEFYAVTAPRSFDGKTFGDAAVDLKQTRDCILMAVGHGEDPFEINPPVDRVLRGGDRLLVVARAPIASLS